MVNASVKVLVDRLLGANKVIATGNALIDKDGTPLAPPSNRGWKRMTKQDAIYIRDGVLNGKAFLSVFGAITVAAKCSDVDSKSQVDAYRTALGFRKLGKDFVEAGRWSTAEIKAKVAAVQAGYDAGANGGRANDVRKRNHFSA